MAANRRQYSAAFKAKVVLKVLSDEKTSGDICQTHTLNANVLNRWRKEFKEAIIKLAGQHPTYGYRRIMALLKRQGHEVNHMAEVGQAWQDGYAERLMRTIKEEEVDLSKYRNFTEAYEQIEQFLEDMYMKKRIHLSLVI